MDIASVEFLSSRSIEAFIDHPHVLDGALGRSLAYLGTALLLGLRIWLQTMRSNVSLRLLPYQAAALAAGFTGAFLAIHGALSEAVDPFSSAFSMQETSISLADYCHMLFHTTYGQAWVTYGALLTAGILLVTRPLPAWLAAVGSGAALAVCGHSGEYGLDVPLYWFGAAHLLLALGWFGGFMLLVIGRLGRGWRAEYLALQYFSRLALPLFILIVLTGVIRLGLQYYYESGLGVIYLVMLVFKLAAAAGVVISAARLRSLLKSSASTENHYDNKLATEVFFALLLIFAAALLTQLPPK
jgi:hypothetical protein